MQSENHFGRATCLLGEAERSDITELSPHLVGRDLQQSKETWLSPGERLYINTSPRHPPPRITMLRIARDYPSTKGEQKGELRSTPRKVFYVGTKSYFALGA